MEPLGDTLLTKIGQSLDCPTCGQHFTTAIRRQQHMTFHRPRKLMCYSCKDAEVQFPCYSAMVQHMMTGCGEVNSREIDWLVSCWYQWNRVMIPEVRRKVREKKELAPPVSYRLDEKTDKYFCTICDKVFKLEKGAQMHASSNIHSPNIYRCPACKAEFPSFGALLLHAESLKCSLVIKLDSTLAKLLHFLHLKLAPIAVEEVIKEDLGVLVSKVAPPQGESIASRLTPTQKPTEVPVQAPVSMTPAETTPKQEPEPEAESYDLIDLIDLTDISETIKTIEGENTVKEDNSVDKNKVIDDDKVLDEYKEAVEGTALNEDKVVNGNKEVTEGETVGEDKIIKEEPAVEAIRSRTISTESLTLVPSSGPNSKTEDLMMF